MNQSSLNLDFSPLGKKSAYISTYSPELLFPISRQIKRDEIGISNELPFFGYDTWNAYEVSWLNSKGKPQVAIIQFDISAHSHNIIESKSFKLYLNSFNNTQLNNTQELLDILTKDISKAVQGEIKIKLMSLDEFHHQKMINFSGDSLDDLDIICDSFEVDPKQLQVDGDSIVQETLCSDLLKSNCLVTGQPDWGSVRIQYKGPKINREQLLKYIVSYRNHNEFHEQCVERIFKDLMDYCNPQELLVEARYTRRGGLDINPLRSSYSVIPAENIRMSRQ